MSVLSAVEGRCLLISNSSLSGDETTRSTTSTSLLKLTRNSILKVDKLILQSQFHSETEEKDSVKKSKGS